MKAGGNEDELRIRRFSPTLKNDLKNISKNTGISMASFVKAKLREIADAYPTQMKIRREV
jgi:predicted DNA-binding protein